MPLTRSLPCPQVLEGELQAEATRQQEKVAELQAQLAQKEQAAEHYKGQVCRGLARPRRPRPPGQRPVGKLEGSSLLDILDGEGKNLL